MQSDSEENGKYKHQVSLVDVPMVENRASDSDIHEAVRQAVELIGGPGRFCGPGKVVLVKPNITSPYPADVGNPKVPSAVAKLFTDLGCTVLIGDDPAIPYDDTEAYARYGLHEIAEKSGARVVRLRKSSRTLVWVTIEGYFAQIEVSDYPLEADLVVSVPVLKTVNIAGVSLGMKNLKGCISSRWKRRFHNDKLNQGIVDLASIIRPALTIIDATTAKDTIAGKEYPFGLIAAGDNCVAADAAGAALMGFDPYSIDHIKLAEQAGLGSADLGEIRFLGSEIEAYSGRYRFSAPKNPFAIAEQSGGNVQIVQGGPCSVCLNSLGNSLAEFHDDLHLLEDVMIFVGPEADPEAYPGTKKKILFGNCLCRQRHCGYYVKGCPPTEFAPAETGSLVSVFESYLQDEETRL